MKGSGKGEDYFRSHLTRVLAGLLVAVWLLGGATAAQAGELPDAVRFEDGKPGSAQAQAQAPEPETRFQVRFYVDSRVMLENGREVDIDAAPFIEGGRTFVPARYLAEGLGAEAEYSPLQGEVTSVALVREDRTVFMHIGDYFLTVHRAFSSPRVVMLDAPSRIVDGRTYLPFRAIAEAFGAEVDFGPPTGSVTWVEFRD